MICDIILIIYHALIQRFGSGSVPTHLIGAALLRGEWKAAVDMILDPREGDILTPFYMLLGNLSSIFRSFFVFLGGGVCGCWEAFSGSMLLK